MFVTYLFLFISVKLQQIYYAFSFYILLFWILYIFLFLFLFLLIDWHLINAIIFVKVKVFLSLKRIKLIIFLKLR